MSERRKRLSKYDYAVLFLEQQGLCGCGCGERLVAGEVDEEHTIPHAIKEAKPDSLWRRECHRRKTKGDIKTIAKVNRLAGKTGQTKRRKERGGSSIRNRDWREQYQRAKAYLKAMKHREAGE